MSSSPDAATVNPMRLQKEVVLFSVLPRVPAHSLPSKRPSLTSKRRSPAHCSTPPARGFVLDVDDAGLDGAEE